MDWQRCRNPDEAPTPVAVALSDYCRRAGSPATPAEVREALALVAEHDDLRIRELADSDPEAKPLGPFAVVDVLSGTSPAVAAERQRCGYYQLARTLAAERAGKAAPPAPAYEPPAEGVQPPPRPLTPSASSSRSARQQAAPPPTVAEKIAPKKRVRTEAPADFDASDSLDGAPIGPARRERPEPRGRFRSIATAREPAVNLTRADGEELLGGLLEQHPHRLALLRALSSQYSSRGGPLRLEDLEEALRKHRLMARVERAEREALLASYREHRGAGSRVGWALGLSLSELEILVKAAGVQREVEEIRERFRRETLNPGSLTLRLDLLGRTRYLNDLGIRKRFTDELTRDLKKLSGSARRKAGSYDELLQSLARSQGTAADLLSRALDKLGLAAELRQAFGSSATSHH